MCTCSLLSNLLLYPIFAMGLRWSCPCPKQAPRYANVLGSGGKGKGHPRTGHEGPEGEYRYSSTLSLTSALNGIVWSTLRHATAALPAGKTQYPLYRRLGGPQCRSGRVRKISPPTRIFLDHFIVLCSIYYTVSLFHHWQPVMFTIPGWFSWFA